MNDILRRHVQPADKDLSDREFILAIYGRWTRALEDALIDPSE